MDNSMLYTFEYVSQETQETYVIVASTPEIGLQKAQKRVPKETIVQNPSRTFLLSKYWQNCSNFE